MTNLTPWDGIGANETNPALKLTGIAPEKSKGLEDENELSDSLKFEVARFYDLHRYILLKLATLRIFLLEDTLQFTCTRG